MRTMFRALVLVATGALATVAGVPIAAAQQPAPAAGTPMVNRSADPLLSNFKFRSIGPASMGGRIDDIAVSESDPHIIYIGYAVGGVWKSDNNGTTFAPVFDEQSVASIGDIAIHPTNPNIVYVGTGEANNRQTTSFGDGIYKTTDGGKTWAHIGLRETQSIARIVIDPRNPEVVYAAVAGHLFGPNAERGVYKTTDGGKTWNKIKFIDENTGFSDIVMDPSNSSTLWATSYQRRRSGCCFVGGGPGSGLWKTTDAGRSWNKVTGGGLAPGTYGRLAIDISKSNPGVVYVQVEAGSVGEVGVAAAPAAAPAEGVPPGGGGGGRGGFDWCNNGGPNGGFPAAGRGGNPGADVPGPQKPALDIKQGGVFKSENGGRTWTHMTNCNSRPMYFSQLRVDPQNPNTLYVAGLPMAKSVDGGKTFATLDDAGGNNSPGHVDHHAFWVDPKNSRHLMAGNDGGFNVSWDQGKTWDYVNTMATGLAYWVSADLRRPYYVYTGLQDNGSWGGPSSTRNNEGILNSHWFGIGGGDGFQTAVDPTAHNIVYTESQDGNTNRYDLFTGANKSIRPIPPAGRGAASTDATCVDGRVIAAGGGGRGGGGGGGGRGGQSNVLNATPGDAARFNWNTPYQLSPHNASVVWLGGARLYKSYDRGDTWVQSADLTKQIDRCKVTLMGVAGDLTALSKNDGVSAYSTIIAVSESPVMPGVVWAGTDDGLVQVSRDGGNTFTEVGKNMPGLPANHEHWISRIETSHYDAGTAYVAVDGHRSDDLKPYVFVTKDYGRTFQSVSGNLPAYGNVQVVREDPKNRDLLYVGTEFGLFLSLDAGKSWQKFMNNYPTVRTDDILVHPRDGDLIIGSHGRAVWIADDITPLQQLTQAVKDADAHLFDSRPAVAYLNDRQDGQHVAGQKFFVGENAPRGAAISYYLKSAASGAVKVSISDALGRTLCSTDGPTTAGINRVRWNLSAPMLAGQGGGGAGFGGGGRGGPVGPPNTSCAGATAGRGGGGGGFGGGGGGGAVAAGTYNVTLSVNGKTINKPITVLADVWMIER